MDSPFDILGIEPDADDVEIVRAYRERVKETHPDQGGSTSAFQLVRSAYEEIRAGSPREEPDTEHGSGDEQPRWDGFRVEYLNYEILDDHGWKLDDERLFEKASVEDLDPVDHDTITVRPRESLLEAAEDRGLAWPYACRGGACANCAVAVVEGRTEMPSNHILSSKMVEKGVRLSCISAPITDEMKVVYNIKQLPGLDELRLPAQRFERAHPTD